jgi:hypothetical protein
MREYIHVSLSYYNDSEIEDSGLKVLVGTGIEPDAFVSIIDYSSCTIITMMRWTP